MPHWHNQIVAQGECRGANSAPERLEQNTSGLTLSVRRFLWLSPASLENGGWNTAGRSVAWKFGHWKPDSFPKFQPLGGNLRCLHDLEAMIRSIGGENWWNFQTWRLDEREMLELEWWTMVSTRRGSWCYFWAFMALALSLDNGA